MKYNIIAIEREYASGGNEIGERIARRLDIPCYGQEVLNRAAELMHTVPERLLHLEETTSNSLLYSLGMAAKVMTGERDGLSEEGALYVTEERVIKDMALQGPCVIVGRCAGCILQDRGDVLRVFIHADREFRRKRAVENYGISEEIADNTLKRYDRRRSNFYRANTGRAWDDKKGYHLVLDSSAIGIEQCVRTICNVAEGK
ncbi:MAG: cytidylate kinase-like family protein [Lachnospiraceae bacterium]|nr:cytidylate kinase-like family protein [Lachnospiraceae bacterium]